MSHRAVSALALRKPTIQTKLAVNTPGDIYEQEADAVANAVMSTPAPLPQPDENRERVSSIQRMVEDEEAIQRMAEDEEMCPACQQDVLQRSPEEEAIQRKGDGKPKVSAATAATVSNPGSGSPLPDTIRHRIEPHVGANLSGVRVHQDRRSHAAAASLQARAFTHGQHIFLNRSESSHNLGLMAHESTHVVQQANAPQLQAKPLIQTQLSQSTVQAQPISESTSTQSASDTESTVDRPLSLPTSEAISNEINTPTQPAAQDAAAPTVGTELEADQSAPEEEAAPVSAETAEVNQPAPEGEGEGAPVSTGIELMTPEPPASLSTSERKRLNQAKGRVGATAKAESTLPPAETNVVSARSTVDEPKEEADAKAEGQIVSQLSAHPEPVPTIESICKRIEQIINAEKPDDEEELAEFDAGEAADSGRAELNQKVEGDAQNIQGDYAQLDEPQEGVPNPATGEIEVPPETVTSPEIDATAATPAPIDLNLDEDVAASSQRMTDVGMDREVTRLSAQGAPESPHAKALATQTELEESAQQDVPLVLAAQEQILGSARAVMAAKEQSGETALNQERTGTIGGVLAQQTSMVTAEEQQRLEISTKAKEIVATTRQKVDDLLNPLPQEALKRWEDGKAKVVKKFEEDLVDVTAWVEENKDSLIGGIITYFSGLPDWIERDFRIAKNNFVTGICQLLKDISTYVDSVIAKCEGIIDDADLQHKELFENLPKDLEKWAETERQKFSEQLDGLRNKVAETKDSIARDLEKQAVEAAESARDHIKELRSQARGWLGQIVDAIAEFAGDIARYIIDGLLNLVGIEPAAFWAVVDKIGQAIDAIADDPLGFAGNLLEAVGQGFQLFFDRFGDHMLNGLLDWLFSGLGSVGVEIPKDFSLKSVITFFLQLMGISWERIRRLLAKHIGEENVALIEKAYELIANLIEMGPEGIFEMIKEQLDPQAILDQVLQAAVDYLVEALIEVVSARVVLLFNPVGAIVQAVEAIYRVLKWIFENAARIFSLIETIVNGISKIIAGDVSGMAKAIEEALARLIAPVVDFLAGYAGLGDLPDKIADTIKGFQDWIEGILDKVIGWLADRAKALLQALGIGGEEESEVDETLDPTDHDAVATSAVNELKQVNDSPEDYASLRSQKEQQAKDIEEKYSGILEDGIGLSITFQDKETDEADNDIDFNILVAPNDTRRTGAIPAEFAGDLLGIHLFYKYEQRGTNAPHVVVRTVANVDGIIVDLSTHLRILVKSQEEDKALDEVIAKYKTASPGEYRQAFARLHRRFEFRTVIEQTSAKESRDFIPLSNEAAVRAQETQRSLMHSGNPQYASTNTCASHAIAVLKAGGVSVPDNVDHLEEHLAAHVEKHLEEQLASLPDWLRDQRDGYLDNGEPLPDWLIEQIYEFITK